MKKFYSISFVAATLLSFTTPVSVSANEIEFQGGSLSMELTEDSPNMGSIIFDENGQIIDVSDELLLEKSNHLDNQLSRNQTHFPWGYWTVSTDGFPFVAWGNVRLNSTLLHRTRPYRVSAALLNPNGTLNRSNHVNGSAGQIRTATITGSNSLRRFPSYTIF